MAKIEGPFKDITNEQLAQVLELWNQEYPLGLNYKDMQAFKDFLRPLGIKRHYLIISKDQITAWLVTFDREGDRWFSIIVSPAYQHQGLGKALLSHVMAKEPKLCGWVVDHDRDFKRDGSPYKSPLAFYKKMGFSIDSSMRYQKGNVSCVKIFL